MSPQTATCLHGSQRGSQGGGREGHLPLMVTRLPGTRLCKGITGSSLTAMQWEPLVPHKMRLESLPPEKAHTTQPKQQGRSAEKPTRIESIRNIRTCPVMTHIGELWKEHISHPRKGGGGTGSEWCFPEPSWSISWTRPQAAPTAHPSHSQPRTAQARNTTHKWSPSPSSVPCPQPSSSSSSGGQSPVQPPLAPVSTSAGCSDRELVNRLIPKY